MKLPQNLPRLLLGWYDANKRDLPWRQDKEPYHVWLSEIMLQQTRVEAVKGYYERFLRALPSVEALAQCDDEQLHKLWEGLGYYSRVRNLKKASIQIMELHGGIFPGKYAEILALPGIGEYTAGAISSICFDLPVPAVDGNVLRVVARLTGDERPVDQPAFKKEVTAALKDIYPERAGDFTQSLMELGATLCGPNWMPRCGSCPCAAICKAYKEGKTNIIPVKTPKKEKRTEEMTVLILSCEDRLALRKRPNQGLLASLWEFPHIPGHLDAEQALDAIQAMGLKPRELCRQTERSHIFTHIRWNMRGFYVEVEATEGTLRWLTREQIADTAALPTAFRQFLEGQDHV